MERDNSKAEQEKARYDKEYQKLTKTQAKVKGKAQTNPSVNARNTRVAENAQQQAGATASEQTMEQKISAYKEKIRSLNPLRKARTTFTGTDGSNNPNFEGQDNGLHAWMDVQLNTEEVDDEMICDSKYAKFNSDSSKCYDIDHIPIRGPPKIDKIDSDISLEQIENIANDLMDDDNLSICRNSGILRERAATSRDRQQHSHRD